MTTGATIIGAGPAGALCAALLARRGVSVVLMDKAAFPRSKVCGCCLSASSMQCLEEAGLADIVTNLKGQRLRELSLFAGNQRATMRIPGTSYSVSRSAFDNALVEHAIKCGATFIPDAEASITTSTKYNLSIAVGAAHPRRRLTTKIAIIADGISGTSLKSSAPPHLHPIVAPNSRLGAGAISHCQNSFYSPATIYMAYSKHGYVGLVRLEDNSLDIAAALNADYTKEHQNIPSCIAQILDANQMPIPDDLFEITWKGTVPLTRRRRSVAAERIFVIGDSASYVEPFTGEGIAWALKSATLLAPIAERATHVWQRSQMDEWNSLYQREIVSRQKKTAAISWLLKHDSIATQAAAVLSSAPSLGDLVARFVSQPQPTAGH